jgi:hypothetical protein
VRSDVGKTSDLLKNTEFSERASFLKESIETKLNQIIANQKSSPTNPEQHISRHRDNLQILDDAKKDLALMRSLLTQMKPMPTAVVWRLILAIIIFLGILGGVFYFIWQKQLTVISQDDTFFVPKEGEGEPAAESAPEKNEEKKTT